MAISVELWESGDLARVPALLEVIQHVYGPSAMDWKLFSWKHLHNPWGPSIITCATDTVTGRCVAVRALWAWRLCWQGHQLPCFQPCDTVTHPDYRRRGLFTALTKRAVQEARKREACLLFNFPNPSSRPGYLKLGWVEIAPLIRLVKPILRPSSATGLARAIWSRNRQYVPEKSGQGLSLAAIRELHRGMSSREGELCGHRDEPMLAWRFGDHPRIAYDSLIRGDVGAVYSTGTRGGLREACIVDILGTVDAKSARTLVGAIAAGARADMATVTLTPGNPLTPVLQSAGFWRAPTHGTLVACPLRTGYLPDVANSAWALTGGDIDTF